MRSKKLSFISGLHNENVDLASRVKFLLSGLQERFFDNFEILLVENGSRDGTQEVLDKIRHLYYKNYKVKIFSIADRGLGLAYKRGIEESTGDYVLLSALDLPFGFSDIDQMLSKVHNPKEIVFFSKTHRDSLFQRVLSRRISSKVFNTILKLFFQVDVGDTQGSVFLDSKNARSLLNYADSPSLFFTAQIAIYSKCFELVNRELPVTAPKPLFFRKSTFHLVKDGLSTLKEIIQEARVYKNKIDM